LLLALRACRIAHYPGIHVHSDAVFGCNAECGMAQPRNAVSLQVHGSPRLRSGKPCAEALVCVTLTPVAVAAGEREHIAKAHLLEIEAGERRTAASAAIQNQLAVLVGCDLVDVHFQNAA